MSMMHHVLTKRTVALTAIALASTFDSSSFSVLICAFKCC